MTRLVLLAPVLAGLLLGCSPAPDVPRSEPQPDARVGEPEPVAEEVTHPPADPPDIADYETRPEEEKGIWRDQATHGKVAIKAVDIESGEPIPDQNYHSFQYALQKDHARRRMPAMVDGPRPPAVPDGVREYELGAGFYRLRLDADGYRNTWTHEFEVRKGETTRFTQAMRKANRIRVAVVEEDGAPCAKGTLLFEAPHLRMAVPFTNGQADERFVDVDALTILVDPSFMPEHRPTRQDVELAPGIVNEVTVTVRR